jgi:oligopeptidase B
MQRLFTRRRFTLSLTAASLVTLADRWWTLLTAAHATAMPPPSEVPIAPVVPKTFEAFGRKRTDNYDWLRDRNDPRVVSYLQAENTYASVRLDAIKPLVDEIAAELKARAAEADGTVPVFSNGYFYERRFARGAPYPLILRYREKSGPAEEVVLDVGALAAGALATGNFQYRLGYWTVSPDNTRVAFAVDFTGNLQFRIFVRTFATGVVADQGISEASSNLVFAADGNTLFYVRNEAATIRPYQVWRHRIGSDAASDVMAYEERDPIFSISLDLSKSRKFVLLGIDGERTSEIRYLPAERPTAEFKVMEPRRHGLRYEVDHVGDKFFIQTNLDAPDYRLMVAPEATPDVGHWSEIVAEQPGHHLGPFEAFETFVAVDIEDERGSAIRVFAVPDFREIPLPRPAEVGIASIRHCVNFVFSQ